MLAVMQFVRLWVGRGIDEDGAYGRQCWDLAAKYSKDVIGCPRLPTRVGGNGFAKDCFEKFLAPLPQYFVKVYNDPNNPNQIPLPGDVIVWGDGIGQGGHIAIVLGAQPGKPTFQVFQQNVPNDPQHTVAKIGVMNYNHVLGWLAPRNRPAFETSELPAQPAATHPQPSTEFYTIQPNDTFWGLEEKWGLTHGVLQSLNAAQNPRELRIGQQIRIKPPAQIPVPAKPTEPAPTIEPSEFYTMQAGDTLWELEERFNIPHGTLQRLNPTLIPRQIPIGAKVRIKDEMPAPAQTTAAVQDEPSPAISDNNKADSEVQPPKLADVTPAPAPQPDLQPLKTDPPVFVPPSAIPDSPKLTFWQKHFTKDKVIRDLGALASLSTAVVAWFVDHHAFIAALLSLLSGLLFGSNRLGKK